MRGDRRLAAVLEKACQKGCRFDGWSEHFHFADWLAAFQETGVDPNFYANRTRAFAEVFPGIIFPPVCHRIFCGQNGSGPIAGRQPWIAELAVAAAECVPI